jgi:predicted RNA-binding protein (virulence factor B family)
MENKLGQILKFKVLRETQIGYMLTLNGEDEYFLHKNESNFRNLEPGEEVNGFLYSDKKARIAVTLVMPKVTVAKSGFATVIETNPALGAFVDIGISKDILLSKDDLPIDYSEWPIKGDTLLCILKVKADRLVAKMLNKYEILDLNLHFDLPINEKVQGYVYRITEDGVNIVTKTFDIVFVYKNNMRKKYRLGEEVNVKIIKKNLDDYNGTLIESKAEIIKEDADKILDYLNNNNGIMAITENSDAAVISKVFKISKSAFKNALGYLLKNNLIEIHDDKIILL